MNLEAIRLSVRAITELLLRCGDIDSRFVDTQTMWKGAQAHRKLQAAQGASYQKEVSLKLNTTVAGIPLTLLGRADGIIHEAGKLTIDEIKTTTKTLDKLFEERELHLGQAICYAQMLLESMDDPPDEVTIQLSYYQLDTEEKQTHQFVYTKAEIAAYFARLLEDYAVWLQYERDWKLTRDSSIHITDFPFPSYRKGQRELAVAVYRSIERKKKLYVQAPTGIGKTLSTLFPSIKAMGEGMTEKIFYLTAKTVTRAVAEESMALLADAGLHFKSVTLRAKEKICFCEERICSPDHCEYARGHYDRINEALLDLLRTEDRIRPSIIEEFARKHRVCPYEMALDIAEWADLVICDYNHIFDPVASLKRFFGEEEAMGEYVFLVDETHNLPDRVRDMYSVSLRNSEFIRMTRALRGRTTAVRQLRKTARAVSQYLQELQVNLGEALYRVEESFSSDLLKLLHDFLAAASAWLASEQASNPAQKAVLELYFTAMAFSGMTEIYDERYVSIIEKENNDLVYTLFCRDPSEITRKRLGLARSSVLFSATLTPLPYYREILGGGAEDYLLALPSPFDRKNLLLCAHQGISTKYIHRADSIMPIVETIFHAISAQKGNYIVYFPSYAYMKQVYEMFREHYPDVNSVLQESAMKEEARAEFLERFDAQNDGTLVGFCVLGGIFSEGIDLKGERLIGAIIVGVGLPGIGLRSDLIRDYYDEEQGVGFDYAYVYPGMNKVLQAAGRVIRSEEDRGIVLLIDSRFGTNQYRSLYPAHWSTMCYIDKTEEFSELLQNFRF